MAIPQETPLEWLVKYCESIGVKWMSLCDYEIVGAKKQVTAQIGGAPPVVVGKVQPQIPQKWVNAVANWSCPRCGAGLSNCCCYIKKASESIIWFKIEDVLNEFNSCKQYLSPGHEIGVSSLISFDDDYNQDDCNLVYYDCDTSDIREVRYDLPDARIVKTDKGFHAYCMQYTKNFDDHHDLLKRCKSCDPKWIDIGYNQNETWILRLTNNTKTVLPHFVY